jgi:hypothetical protein
MAKLFRLGRLVILYQSILVENIMEDRSHNENTIMQLFLFTTLWRRLSGQNVLCHRDLALEVVGKQRTREELARSFRV